MSIGFFWWQTLLVWKTLFFHFWTLNKTLLDCWPKIFARFLRTAIYVSIGTLWGGRLSFEKLIFFIFFGHWTNNLGILSKNNRWCCRSCIPCVQRNTLGKLFFWKSNDFVSFGPWVENFPSSRKICSVGLSKLHFTRPNKTKEKVF